MDRRERGGVEVVQWGQVRSSMRNAKEKSRPHLKDESRASEDKQMCPVITYVVEMAGQGFIKIGTTRDLMLMINNVQQGNPYEIRLVARLRGDVKSQLSAALASYHVRGGWFRYDDEVKEIISRLDQYKSGEAHDTP